MRAIRSRSQFASRARATARVMIRVVLSLLLSLVALAAPALAIEHECSACRAVGGEIAAKIAEDAPWKKYTPRTKTDPLVFTEYEMYNALETACGGRCADTSWTRRATRSGSGRSPWTRCRWSLSSEARKPDLGDLDFNKEIGGLRSVARSTTIKQIHAYCVRVLEERDEQLQELIMGKKLTEDNVEEVVVREMCEWTGEEIAVRRRRERRRRRRRRRGGRAQDRAVTGFRV